MMDAEDKEAMDDANLFSCVSGGGRSLDDLIDDLASCKQPVHDLAGRFPVADSAAPSVIVRVSNAAAEAVAQKKRPTTILKKLNSAGGGAQSSLKQPSVKRVIFDVQKLVATESASGGDRELATAELVRQLGATPAKNVAVNYKTLKEQRRAAKKKNDDNAIAALSKPTMKKKAKGKKQKKR